MKVCKKELQDTKEKPKEQRKPGKEQRPEARLPEVPIL